MVRILALLPLATPLGLVGCDQPAGDRLPIELMVSDARLSETPGDAIVGGGIGDVVASGDIDGDGGLDLVVTRPTFGDVAVFMATATGYPETPDLTLEPPPGRAGFGIDLALGDTNADGRADLIVGQNDGSSGSFALFRGTSSGLSPSGAMFTHADAGFGASVAIVGDVNGDGYGDVAVGAAGAGHVHVYYGSSVVPDPTPSLTLSGTGGFGTDVARASDLDGDGIDDLAIGAPDEGGGLGAVHFAFGAPGGPAVGASVAGFVAGGRLGERLQGIGDLDGDGLTTVAVVAPAANGGRVFLFDAAPGTTSLVGQLRPTPGSMSYGRAVVGLDHNSDGYADVAVGASGAGIGVVLLYMGSPSGIVDQPLHAWQSPPTRPGFGAALTRARPRSQEADGLGVGEPAAAAGRVVIFPGSPDIDGDHLEDAIEWPWGVSPFLADTDGDTWTDRAEWGRGEQPRDQDLDGLIDALDPDSDADGFTDDVDNCPWEANADQRDSDGDGWGDVCQGHDECDLLDPRLNHVAVDDLGDVTGFDDFFGGHFKRGRSLLAADFDLDGRIDFYLGNPGDESLVVRNVDDGAGGVRFELVQVLVSGEPAWGGATADFDNDGDYDIYIANGGNECYGFDFLFRNELMETGTLSFTDVTATAGISGPLLHGRATPVPQNSTSGTWGDYDNDGDVDLFVNSNGNPTACGEMPEWHARNTVWRNNGDGTFTDVTEDLGIDSTIGTYNSTWVDYDNDGDIDLYESAFNDFNILWHNDLKETGTARFRDVTAAVSTEADLANPRRTFASCADDFDNDGWLDIINFHRGATDCGSLGLDQDSNQAHALFLNRDGGTRFVDVADRYGLNDHPVQAAVGVMGCQIGDLDGDGWLDVYVGNGGPSAGEPNQLFLFSPAEGRMLQASPLIDFPSPSDPGFYGGPMLYPYRTHGSAFIDIDNDGKLELAISNGGPQNRPNVVREPNRMFSFDWGAPVQSLRVRFEGDGVRVSRDGIGTRATVTFRRADGSTRSVHRYLSGGSCFSAHQSFELYFGLADAVAIERLEVLWTDGTRRTLTSGLAIGDRLTVTY